MAHERPIDRVRDAEEKGRDQYDDARETYAENEAQIKRNAHKDPPEREGEENFKKRMEEKLKESGKKIDDKA